MSSNPILISIIIEPTEDWTVEQLLQWCLQKSQSTVNSKTDELVNALQELQDNAERDIWELHTLAVKQNMETDVENETETETETETDGHAASGMDAENIDPNINVNDNSDPLNSKTKQSDEKAANANASTSESTSASKPKAQDKKKKHRNLHINVQSGSHEGATFLLKPRPSRPCEIGRSKGKKFLQRGVSLFKDAGVSTCHGKFENKAGKIYYTDTGSTNGTSYNGEAIEDHVPMELTDGMVLAFGDCELEFTIVDN